jgi:hypothetical protein
MLFGKSFSLVGMKDDPHLGVFSDGAYNGIIVCLVKIITHTNVASFLSVFPGVLFSALGLNCGRDGWLQMLWQTNAPLSYGSLLFFISMFKLIQVRMEVAGSL